MGSQQISASMSPLQLLLLACLCLGSISCQRADFVTEIEPDYGPDWGDWNGGVYCPENQFARGFKQERLCSEREYLKEAQQNYQSYQGMWVDDSGSNGVSFICNNGTDLLAGPDTVWRPDNVWTSFVSCPGDSLICGFETKGHTAFPDNSEIDRVRFFCCDPNYQP